MIISFSKYDHVSVASNHKLFVCLMQALLELEMNSDLKAQLRELHITAAKVKALLVHSF